MAFPAGLDGLPGSTGGSFRVFRGENEMFPVTVRTGRAVRHTNLEGPPVNGPVVLELNVRMALAAGGRHVPGVDSGFGVGSAFQIMDAVAIGAGSRRCHTPGGSLAVDGTSVLLEDWGKRTNSSVRSPASPWHSAQVLGRRTLWVGELGSELAGSGDFRGNSRNRGLFHCPFREHSHEGSRENGSPARNDKESRMPLGSPDGDTPCPGDM